MVMYEDDCKGKLYLKYEVTPSANEVINDVLNAPIESGETFQNKRKGVIQITDKFIFIDAPSIGKKAKEEVVAAVTEKTGWKSSLDTFSFALPENAESEQASLMRG